jgi:hypothetical protein
VNLDCFIAACVSSWAARVVALPRTIITAIGGKADMHGREASTISVAFDPERTLAGNNEAALALAYTRLAEHLFVPTTRKRRPEFAAHQTRPKEPTRIFFDRQGHTSLPDALSLSGRSLLRAARGSTRPGP